MFVVCLFELRRACTALSLLTAAHSSTPFSRTSIHAHMSSTVRSHVSTSSRARRPRDDNRDDAWRQALSQHLTHTHRHKLHSDVMRRASNAIEVVMTAAPTSRAHRVSDSTPTLSALHEHSPFRRSPFSLSLPLSLCLAEQVLVLMRRVDRSERARPRGNVASVALHFTLPRFSPRSPPPPSLLQSSFNQVWNRPVFRCVV